MSDVPTTLMVAAQEAQRYLDRVERGEQPGSPQLIRSARSVLRAAKTLDPVGLEKIRENRIRRMAARQGLHIVKSRRRDSHALGHGGFMIVDAATNSVVAGELNSPRSLSLDQVEDWLTR
jgi:hypothetical protein